MIKTDYSKISTLFLVYPENFETEYHELTPLFEELISLCPNDIIYFIIVNNHNSAKNIKKRFREKDIRPIVISDFYEIWLRDIMGFAFTDKVVKPFFQPDYNKEQYPQEYLELIDKQTQYIISKSINVPIYRIPLAWDGGNLGTNGKIAFVTKKIIPDNPKFNVKEIIERELGLKPIFLPVNKYDTLGHTDGYIAFINDNEVLMPILPDFPSLHYDIEYLKEIERIVINEKIKICHLYDRPIVESPNSNIGNAVGNYINFLNVNGNIIQPTFNTPNYKKQYDYNLKNNLILNEKFNSIQKINATKLAKLGGVLHCISWLY